MSEKKENIFSLNHLVKDFNPSALEPLVLEIDSLWQKANPLPSSRLKVEIAVRLSYIDERGRALQKKGFRGGTILTKKEVI